MRYPLIAPNPPRLSEMADALRRIEASGIYSNNGPEVRAFEREATERLFGGTGASLAVANATLGLTLAIRAAAGASPARGTMALMPALTFAATAQAAHWAGLTPLVCDIDADDWAADPDREEALLRRYGGRIGVIVPYATFGTAIDLDRYAWLAERHGIGVVIDAAGSIGTIDEAGRGFGTGAPFAVVFSMHATKGFAVGEGGLIHSDDARLIDRLRAMAGFGFESGRTATLPGLNAKLPEVIAAMARAKLATIDVVADGRAALEHAYRAALRGFDVQEATGWRRAAQFMPVLLPPALAGRRDAIVAGLEQQGIGCGRYFSPHLGQQPWIREIATIEPTPIADAIAGRMLSLPVTDAMSPADAAVIAAALRAACRGSPAAPRIVRPAIADTMLIGGGPAGTAMLVAAAKRGTLPRLAAGLTVVDRDHHLGGGRLGGYAITSDSTAETFLTALDNPVLAGLADGRAARGIADHRGSLGVPLAAVAPLLRAVGARLGAMVEGCGGQVLTGHDALGATRGSDGMWRVRLRRLSDGQESERLARNLVIATGGHQPLDRLAGQKVAGGSLRELAGDRLIQSDEVLTAGGMDLVTDLLAGARAPRVAVVGGSTSALATVALLLKRQPALGLGAGAVTLVHRRPLRPFYPSADAARADGFTDFGPDDVCPVSGFVYRLAGFRLEARDLVLRMLAVGGRAPDPRVALTRADTPAARRAIGAADVVIAALGYRPRALPLADDAGRIVLAADKGAAMVDRHCRVLDSAGRPLAGVYGIGLAAGFVPWGAMGGEPSFRGQANGLWQWQNDVGAMIVDQLLAVEARAAA